MSKVIAERLGAYRRDPVLMVRELFGVEPDAWQATCLREFPNNQRIALCASKGVGKSCLLAWLVWNFLLTRPTPKIAVTSITADNLSNGLWAELAYWMDKSPLLKELFTFTKTRIFAKSSPETWFCAARSWSKSASAAEVGNTLAGLHADYIMFILDETGGFPEAIMASAEAALSSCVEGHIVQAGNPTHLAGPLYNACTKERALWKVINISSDPDDPNRSSRVSVQWANEQIMKYGRDNPFVLVNVFGKFPPTSFDALIGPDEVQEAMKRFYKPSDYNNSAVVLGIDVAGSGADSSVVFRRQGLQAFIPTQFRNIDGTEGANRVARIWDEHKADACFIDNTGGFGATWLDNLRRIGYSPLGIHFNGSPISEQYVNKRSEMMFECVDWIKKGGAIPNIPELMAALTQTNYSFQKDKLIIEPKADIKAKLGYSPDHLDSLCVIAGTMISTPNGDVPIEDLRIGDMVCTPFGDTRIVKTWLSNTAMLANVGFSNGKKLSGKPNHKVFVYGSGARKLGDLKAGLNCVDVFENRHLWAALDKGIEFREYIDSLSGIGMNDLGLPKKTLVKSKEITYTSADVYNLTLEKHNAYYANGILVYNCLTFASPVFKSAPLDAYSRMGNMHRSKYDPFSPLKKR